MATDPAIEISNLHVRYGDVDILQDVNLTVERGEVMVIMGGSGSGKSTFLRQLLGLEKPYGGSIKLLGKDITTLTGQEMYQMRKEMGVAFQGGALFNSMTVGENVMLPLREHVDLNEQTMQIMARMKLEVVNLAGFENLMPERQ
ncbi:ABC transporter ATP-binding protein [Solemya velum gill symbiont]|uniref:ABC transporter ATP-binding protein n=1 Tax=Solemya velum gill symbiont TaxID=2340 RepID=UPI002DDD56D5|nr:ATP-binding cassette domain-containing protein [Solemya velum gill symbiont]